MDQADQTQKKRLIRHLPLAVILAVAVVGALTLGDVASFDTLRQHRERLVLARASPDSAGIWLPTRNAPRFW